MFLNVGIKAFWYRTKIYILFILDQIPKNPSLLYISYGAKQGGFNNRLLYIDQPPDVSTLN